MKQKTQRFEKEIIKRLALNYLLYLPEGCVASGKKWPLILFLHGAGECGDDVEIVKRNGIPKRVEEVKDFPFIAVSPQCPEGSWWGDEIEALVLMLDDIIKTYSIDLNRVYLTGLSMGGYGTWLLGALHPERFAAIAPICGGGDPQWTELLKDIPIWAFHGAKDDIVPISESEVMVAAVKAAGGDIRFTVYPDTGHNSWVEAYDNPELYEWFLKTKKN